MNIIYPISYLTNSFKAILSCFLDEITVLFPFSDYYEKEQELIKVKIFNNFSKLDSISPKEISNIINWAGQFENLSHSILSDTLQSVNATETINEIISSLKKSHSHDVRHFSQEKKSLLLRFFYEYDVKQDEINADYKDVHDKFTNLSKILNGNEESEKILRFDEQLHFNPASFNILKPALRLKLWSQFFSEIPNDNEANYIGISREIKDIVGDVYFNLTGELPEILLELDCDKIKLTKDNKKNITIFIDKLFALNKQHMTGKSNALKQILTQLETYWKFSYKPEQNSVIKLYFMKLSRVGLRDILLYNAGLKGKSDMFFKENDEIAVFVG